MIKSMTGFASLSRDDERGAVGVTIRSVNHRFLDLQLRLPPSIADVEPRLRAIVQKQLARGRVEISVSLQLRQTLPPVVELNEEFAKALAGAMEQARDRGLVAGTLTPGDLLRLPQALSIRERLPEAGGVSAQRSTRRSRSPSINSKRCACAKACICAPTSIRARLCSRI
jgi:uncharacterized protein (TIGR00255 family)